MASNSFGLLFRVTTWGESHGPAIGCVVDGVPPRLALAESDIQPALDRRRPGTSRFVTQRRESDTVRILSGVFEGQTTGTPIALVIENEDARSRDYGPIKETYRPGHADFTYDAKYGIRDYRGGGRASARETAMRVAAGAIAQKILGDGVTIRGAVIQVGEPRRRPRALGLGGDGGEPLLLPRRRHRAGLGRRARCRPQGRHLPRRHHRGGGGRRAGGPGRAGLRQDRRRPRRGNGRHQRGQGVEIGAGFAAAAMSGDVSGDEIRMEEGAPRFLTNNAGGVLGGITTGQPVVVRFVVKPTSSIRTPRRTITAKGEETEVSTEGRHDPCVGLRAVPVGEAMMACVLADHLLRHRAQCG